MDNKGVKYSVEILDNQEYEQELIKKLDEEVAEFKQDKNIKELADILEVIDYLAQSLDSDFDEVCKIKAQKAKDKGGFDKKIFLKYCD